MDTPPPAALRPRLIRRTLTGFLWLPSVGRVRYYVDPIRFDQSAYIPSLIVSWGWWSFVLPLAREALHAPRRKKTAP